ncbi:radical SAM protein, partial [candidate division WOR-3 bacterium]|nr:radical SAM protein [candidate division WOR-3 bacterium]
LRVRLASLDPAALDEKLPAVLADPRICPHFHLSLQSGDDELLRRMGRRYTAAGFAELAGRLRAVRPEACIGADIIVGFPGEDEVSFRRTRGVLDALPVDYLHVFSYSPRPGTPAFCLADTVASVEKRARVRELRSFSDRRRAEFGRRHIGSVREAVVESNRTALTDNYIRLAMPAAMAAPGALVGMLIERSGGRYVGRPTTPVTA